VLGTAGAVVMSLLGWGIQADALALAEAGKAEEDVRTWDETVAELEQEWLKDIETPPVDVQQPFFSEDQVREIVSGLDDDQLLALENALYSNEIDQALEDMMNEGKL
jgi:hypothetical protein